MKILLVSTLRRPVREDVFASRSRIIYQLGDGLSKKGHEVTLLGTGDSHIPGVKIIPVIEKSLLSMPPVENPFLEAVAFQIQQAKMMVQLQDDFDVIHNHTYPDFFPHIVENDLHKPLVSTLHALYDPAYMDQTLSLFTRSYFVALSKAYANLYDKTKFFSVVYNGVNTELYAYSQKKDDYMFWLGRLPSGKNAEGSFMDPKGVRWAIELAEKTNQRLLLSGIVEDKEFFERDIKPHLNEKIQWVGGVTPEQSLPIEKVVELMQGARVFLMTVNQQEPFGLVMAEAMSCGTPVIAFSRGSVPEVIEDGKTGLIVNQADETTNAEWIIKESGMPGLIDAVNKLYEMDQNEYAAIQEACRKHVEEHFTIDKMVSSYEEVYKKLIESYEVK